MYYTLLIKSRPPPDFCEHLKYSNSSPQLFLGWSDVGFWGHVPVRLSYRVVTGTNLRHGDSVESPRKFKFVPAKGTKLVYFQDLGSYGQEGSDPYGTRTVFNS